MEQQSIQWPELEIASKDLSVEFIEEMKDRLFEQEAVVTGNLARSIIIKDFEVKYDKFIRSRVEMLEYGEWVDSGAARGPGRMPPLKPILEWIRLRNIKIPRGFTKEKWAYVIAQSIAKKGQRFKKPKPFIEVSLNNVIARNINADTLGKAAAVDINQSIIDTANQSGLEAK